MTEAVRHHPLLVVSGPTAVGKTDFTVELAERFDGEIVNVDSVQCYREADIGSAKPPPELRRRIRHHLLDVWSPGEGGNAAVHRELTLHAVEEIRSRGRTPILSGGTTMYVTTFFQGMAELPSRSPVLRARLEQMSGAELKRELSELDPATADRLHENDRHRLIRALEASLLSGATVSSAYERQRGSGNPYRGLFLILLRPRDELYRRIEERARLMVGQGLLDEVERIRSEHGEAPVLSALGYAQAVECLNGVLEKERLADEIALYTRRYAKRQMTYWRNEPIKRGWATRPGEHETGIRLGEEGSKYKRNQLKGFKAYEFDAESLFERIRARISQPFERNEVWYLSADALAQPVPK